MTDPNPTLESAAEIIEMLEAWVEPPGVTGSLDPEETQALLAHIRSLRTERDAYREALERCDKLTSVIQHGNHALVICGQVGEVTRQALRPSA